MKHVTLSLAVLSMLCVVRLAQADPFQLPGGGAVAPDAPIQYLETAYGSGWLGGTWFSDQLVRIAFVGDTATGTTGTYSINSVGTTYLQVGSTTATFTDTMAVFDNQLSSPMPAAGIGDVTVGGSVLDTFAPDFGSYNLIGGIGPVSGPEFINSGLSFNTTAGTFILEADPLCLNCGTSTFTAIAGGTGDPFTPPKVPEPSTLTLLGTALIVGFIGLRKRWS